MKKKADSARPGASSPSTCTKTILAIAIISVLLFGMATATLGAAGITERERDDLKYFEIVNDSGEVLFETGHVVSVGDKFISEDNDLYEIHRVQGDKARAKFIERVNLSDNTSTGILGLVSRLGRTHGLSGTFAVFRSVKDVGMALKDVVVSRLSRILPVQGRKTSSRVGIYSTHSDESYLPTDGSPSIRGNGGVFKVAASLASSLRKNGLDPVVRYTPHDPHDAGAYDRSRRTAMDLAQQRPAALLDIHRDTAPAEAYRQDIGGKTVGKVMLVVGRQNPGMQANLAFAKRLKDAADKRYPGLVRGIFFANGKYNQDLHPRALLWEVGSYKNRRDEAENGVALLGSILPEVLGATGPGASTESRRGFSLVGWVIGLVIVGAVVYLFLSTGSWEEAKAKLRRIRTEEFSSFLGLRDFLSGRSTTQQESKTSDSDRSSGGSVRSRESESEESVSSGDEGVRIENIERVSRDDGQVGETEIYKSSGTVFTEIDETLTAEKDEQEEGEE